MDEKELAIKAAKEAGAILMRYYGKSLKVKEKSPQDYVSEADIESEKKVISLIKKHFPEHAIISEEAGQVNLTDDSNHVWYVDPLDGTHNFIHRLPFFGVSVAYSCKDEVKVGVIYCPCVDELYVAEKGKGAFCNGKRLSVSDRSRMKDALVIVDAALHRDKKMKFELLSKLVDECFRVRILGAAVYNCISVAVGGAEAYIEFSTHPWDVAAGLLIIEEAGGRVSGINGERWNVKTEEFIATNGKMHGQFLKLFTKK